MDRSERYGGAVFMIDDCNHRRQGCIKASSRNTFLMNSFTRYFCPGGGTANAGCCFVEVGVLGFVEAGVADGPTGMLSSEVVTPESLHLDARNGNVVGRSGSTPLVTEGWAEYAAWGLETGLKPACLPAAPGGVAARDRWLVII
ncbi:MAG TPA: hypothetical protein VG425_00345 [Casimicrobiaceae bacterium]|nr:hypothetical protein [Casimicrobiaceae bacterium]